MQHTTDTELPLLDLDGFQPVAADRTPPCGICARPRRWIEQRQDYALYCAGNHCSSRYRTCKSCGEVYDKTMLGAGSRYCSQDCVRKRKLVAVTCAWCDATRPRGSHRPQGEYLCATCVSPIKSVLERLRSHRVPIGMYQQLIDDPTCRICASNILKPARLATGRVAIPLVVDHDHACCPSKLSCGRCVRGFLCMQCNHMLGEAYDNPEVLESAAAYLRSAALRIQAP